MADITAKDVAALRKVTGAGMMDCKKALEETGGDIDAAKDWLREKGLAGAAKREGRDAERGRDRGRRRRQRRRARRAQLRDRLRRQGRRVQASRSPALTQARRSSEGDDDLGEQDLRGRDRRRLREGHVGHARREDRARPRRPLRDDRRPARRLQARPERARHDRRARRARRRRPGERAGPRGRARHRAAHRRAPRPATSSRDDVPGRRGRARARGPRGADREEGKPEQAWPKIVDGQAQRLLQDGRAARAGVREGPQADDRGAASTALGGDASVRRFARVKIGEE